MTLDGLSLAATIIMIFPMMYFLIVTPTFFLMKFDDPVVTWLWRKLFNVYFLAVSACCAIGIASFAMAGRPFVTLGLILLTGLAVVARRWFLRHMDEELGARDAGDVGAIRRLRRLHIGGMVYNSVQLAAILVSLPFIFVALT